MHTPSYEQKWKMLLFDIFQKDLHQRFDQYLHHNEKASKKKCQDLLTSLSAKMTDQLQKGFYAKPGGYKLFSKDMESIVEEYNSQTTKLVKVIHIRYSKINAQIL